MDRDEIMNLLGESNQLVQIARTFDAALQVAGETAQARESQAREQAAGRVESTATEQAASYKYALVGYTEHEKNNWAGSKSIVIYKDVNQLSQFIDDALNGKNIGKKMYFGKIPANMAQDIKNKTGIGVEGYNSTLHAQEVRKINKNHGNQQIEALRGQRAITAKDYERIPDVLQGYDSVVLSADKYDGKPVLEFRKQYNDGKMTVIGVVSDKHLDLFVQTMYSSKSIKSLATPTDDQASVNTPKATRGTAPADNISQEAGTVKGAEENSLKNQDRFSMKQPVERKGELVAVLLTS